jgi:hypothetical protein
LVQADPFGSGTSILVDAKAVLEAPNQQHVSGATVATWHYLKDDAGGLESAVLGIRFGSDGKMETVVRNPQTRLNLVGQP